MIRSALRRAMLVVAGVLVASMVGAAPLPGGSAGAQGYARISGEGSSWAANAIEEMRTNVEQFGIIVDYNPSGSTNGRKNYLRGIVDFAASDIAFQFEPEDGSEPDNPEPGSYAYIPVTAGGTAFMYNLKINGQQVSNLRLSGENVSKIFTGVITQWNDPAIAADNPGLVMPAQRITPVVRSDGSGSTAQFTKWMIAKHAAIWQDFCERSGRAPACGFTSQYPQLSGLTYQAQDTGVAAFVSSPSFGDGTIGYVNYSYALGQEFPVAKLLNDAGYYTEPTPENVAVSLLKARINNDPNDQVNYLTQDLTNVYSDSDPRNYQLSSYSYFILPTKTRGNFTEDKGRTLGAFAYYAMCQAQQDSASLGYSPLPINLVEASLEQIKKIPGVEVQNVNVQSCNNPTFSPDGTNVLAQNAPQPKACDQVGFPSQCPDGTGGLRVPTAVKVVDAGTGGATTGGATTGGATTGGATTGGATTGGATTGGATTGGATTEGATTGGATTGGATTGGATTGGATVDPATGAVIDPATGEVVTDPAAACDPDTGLCGPTAQGATTGGVVAGGTAVGAIAPTTLDKDTGWGATQLLTVLVAMATCALVIAPVLAWRRLGPGAPA
jgi:phosphate ABC transporter phosphate-binding protein